MLLLSVVVSVASGADLTVQSRLLSAVGSPIHGTHDVAVRLYTDPTEAPPAAELVFEGLFDDVPVQDGYVSLRLLGVPEAGLAQPLWMAFDVDGVGLGARQPLASVPHAAVSDLVVRPATALQLHQDALRPADGVPLASCAAYLTHSGYRGETWERFWVDPDGAAGSGAPMALLCDQVTDGGGWAVWEAGSGPWGWDNDGRICYDVTLFTEGQAWQMSRYPHSETRVDSDSVFRFQEDDSVNVGSVYARTLASVASPAAFDGSFEYRMHFSSTASNHVDIVWSPNGYDRVRANCSTSSPGCGTANIPANGADSAPMILTRIEARPNCSGSSTLGSEWQRNATSLIGSRYQVFMR